MPQRFLRPQIRQSKRWNRVGLLEQSLYVRLLTLVDDYARYEADPELIRSEAFPYGDELGNSYPVQTIEASLRTLADKDLVLLYEKDGVKYLQLTRWKERPRTASKYPSPPLKTNVSKCFQMLASPPSPSPSPSPVHTDAREEKPLPEIPTREEAIDNAKKENIPADFAGYVFDTWESREGRDGAGVITSFAPYVKRRWTKEGPDWTKGVHHSQNASQGKPERKELPEKLKAKRL